MLELFSSLLPLVPLLLREEEDFVCCDCPPDNGGMDEADADKAEVDGDILLYGL